MYRKNTTSILNEWKSYLEKSLNESQMSFNTDARQDLQNREREDLIGNIIACRSKSDFKSDNSEPDFEPEPLSETGKAELHKVLEEFRAKVDNLINDLKADRRSSTYYDDVLEAVLRTQSDDTLEIIGEIADVHDASEEGLSWMAKKRADQNK